MFSSFVPLAQHPVGSGIRIASSQRGRRSQLNKKHTSRCVFDVCAPTGIRTPVVALKGLRPSPLDDGGIRFHRFITLCGISESGRILSSQGKAVKHFELFVVFGTLTQQGEHIHLFAVEEQSRALHLQIGNQDRAQCSLI
jgi:hypothetical protein